MFNSFSNQNKLLNLFLGKCDQPKKHCLKSQKNFDQEQNPEIVFFLDSEKTLQSKKSLSLVFEIGTQGCQKNCTEMIKS